MMYGARTNKGVKTKFRKKGKQSARTKRKV